MDKIIPIFLSVGKPHKENQKKFLKKFESLLKRRGLKAVTLGRSSYNFKSPLGPVKEIMDNCFGVIILGFERTHCFMGIDKQGSKEEKEFVHRYLSTPWNQIEAGMAFEKNLPLLVMKEKHLAPYGILDPQLTGYFVLDLDLDVESIKFERDFLGTLTSWIESVKVCYNSLMKL